MTTEMSPMTVPRRGAGTIIMDTVIKSGMMTAVPSACKMRATSMMAKFGDTAAIMVPTKKVTVANKNTDRVVKRSSIQPVAGKTTAMVNMKPVSSH